NPGDPVVETQGAITALRQTVTTTDPGGGNPKTLAGLIQFGGPLSVADSGGPLIDDGGRVIGVDTEGAAQVRLRQVSPDTAFAIPVNSAMAVGRDIESGTPNPRVLSGQSVVLGVDVADSLSARGAQVTAIEAGSPAQAAGLVPGDIIVSVGGTSVDSASALSPALQRHHPGDQVVVVWLDPLRRQPQRRLVEHEERPVALKRPADRHHLLLAAAQAPGELSVALAEAGEQRVHAVERFAHSPAIVPRVSAHLQVLSNRHASEETP